MRLLPEGVLVGVATVALLAAACGGESEDRAAPSATESAEESGAGSDADAAITDAPTTLTPSTPGASEVVDAGSSTTKPPAPVEAPNGDAFVPGAGMYRYAMSGYEESGEGATFQRRELSGTEVDEVTTRPSGTTTELTVRMEGEGTAPQEVAFLVDSAGAVLTRLTYFRSGGGVETEQSVRPDPPIRYAMLPYQVGATWESAWSDPFSGISGAGTGEVVGFVDLSVPFGAASCVEIINTQRIRGAVSGEISIRSWVERTTGRVWKRITTTDLLQPSGPYRSEITVELAAVGG